MQLVRLALAAAFAFTAATSALADEVLTDVIAGEQRAPENRLRDAHRHPAESLAFWGLAPGARVIEVAPGGGYWTEILAPYAMLTKGAYAAGVADLENPAISDGARRGREAFAAKYADTATFGTVELLNFGPSSAPLGPPGSADLVLTARNIHNWMWTPGVLDKAFSDFYAVLKPGGVLAVEEHRADPRPQVDDARDGYVATATVVEAARKAGFVLDGESEINANPKDDKDHPFGVWTLPPVRRSAEAGKPADPAFDRASYDAIGESDRMTLRFRKPAAERQP